MTELLLLIPTALLVGYLLWQADRRTKKAESMLVATLDEWSEQRVKDRDTYEAERAKLLDQVTRERKDWATERAQLLNRIQRPDTAVYESFEPLRLKGHAGFDNDEEVWEAISEIASGD